MNGNKIIPLHQNRQSKMTDRQRELIEAEQRLNRIVMSNINMTFSTNQLILDTMLEDLLETIEEPNNPICPHKKARIKEKLVQGLKKSSALTTVSFVNALPEIYPHLFSEQ